jgi:hypothetical protein
MPGEKDKGHEHKGLLGAAVGQIPDSTTIANTPMVLRCRPRKLESREARFFIVSEGAILFSFKIHRGRHPFA